MAGRTRRREPGGTTTQLILAAMTSTMLIAAGGASAPQETPEPAPEAGTQEACGQCHRDRLATVALTPHAGLDLEGLSSRAGEVSSCTACHGVLGKEYAFAGAMSDLATTQGCQAQFAFSPKEAPAVKAQRCLACHARSHPRFQSSRHAQAGMDCTSCHDLCAQQSRGHWPLQKARTAYGSATAVDISSDVCWECHGDIVSLFGLNKTHRLEEGVVECTSCHNPHESDPRLSLGGFKQARCTHCHQDKAGPFAFEHSAVKVEGCLACHDAHGSPNRHMLAYQSVAELCYSCHALVPGFHSRFDLDTVCTNCHASIHGSFLDRDFLR